MLKTEFAKYPTGTIFKVPGTRKIFIKSEVSFEGKYQELPYDGKKSVLCPEDIPDGTKILADPLIYVPDASPDDLFTGSRKNWERLKEIDQIQKKKGKLLFRYITFPYADGKAVYQIVYVSGNNVRLKLVTGIGDDWQIPQLWDGCFLSKDIAACNVGSRDQHIELIMKKRDKKNCK